MDSTTGLCKAQLQTKTGALTFETIILQVRGSTVDEDIRPLDIRPRR